MAGNEEIKILVKSLLPAIEKLMDDQTMMGNLSENRMRHIVMDESLSLWNELRELRALLEQERGRHNPPTGNTDRSAVTAPDKYMRWQIKGVFRRVPQTGCFRWDRFLMCTSIGIMVMNRSAFPQ